MSDADDDCMNEVRFQTSADGTNWTTLELGALGVPTLQLLRVRIPDEHRASPLHIRLFLEDTKKGEDEK